MQGHMHSLRSYVIVRAPLEALSRTRRAHDARKPISSASTSGDRDCELNHAQLLNTEIQIVVVCLIVLGREVRILATHGTATDGQS